MVSRLRYLLLLFGVFLSNVLVGQKSQEYYQEFSDACYKQDYQKVISYEKDLMKEIRQSKIDTAIMMYLATFAECHFQLGDYSKSISNYKEAIKIGESYFGKENQFTIDFYNGIIENYEASKDFKNELIFIEKKLKTAEKLFGSKDVKIGFIWNKKGNVLFENKEYEKALKCYFQSESVFKPVKEEYPYEYSFALENIGFTFNKIKTPAKASPYLKSCLEIRKRVLGFYSKETLIAYFYLGETKELIQDIDSTRFYWEKSLLIADSIFTQPNYWHLKILSGLVEIENNSGNYQKALEINYKKLFVFSKDSSYIKEQIFTKNDIVLNLISLNRFDEAQKIQNDNILVCINEFGKNHFEYWNCLNNLGLIHSGLADHNFSLEINTKALELAKNLLGERSSQYRTSLNNMAINYAQIDNFNESLKINKKLVKLNKQVYGENHHSYIKSLNNLTHDYLSLRNFKVALTLSDSVYMLAKNYFGEDHTTTISYLFSLSNAYEKNGDIEKSKDIIHKGLELIENKQGKQSDYYLEGLKQLVSFYQNIDSIEKAIATNQRVLDLAKIIYGEKHLKYRSALDKLALIFEQTGNYEKAIEIDRKKLSLLPEGMNHKKNSVVIKNTIVINLIALKRFREALLVQNENIALCKEEFGENHHQYWNSLNNLGLIHSGLLDYNTSSEFHNKALNLASISFGKTSYQYRTSLNNLAVSYSENLDFDKCLKINKKLVALRKDIYGVNSHEYIVSLNNLSQVYLSLGNLEIGLNLSDSVYILAKKLFGEEHPKTISYLLELGNYQNESGNLKKASFLIQKGLELTEKNLGKESHYYLTGLTYLKKLYLNNDSIKNAISTNHYILKLTKKLFGETSVNYRLELNNLASLYNTVNNYEKANEIYHKQLTLLPEGPKYKEDSIIIINDVVLNLILLKRYDEALEIQNKNTLACLNEFGKSHKEYWECLNNLGLIYSRLRDYKSSIEINTKALELAQVHFTKKSHNYRTSLNNLAINYSNNENFNEAKKIHKKLVSLNKEIYGTSSINYLKSLNNLSIVYTKTENFELALLLSDSVYNLAKIKFGEAHPKTIDYLFKLSGCYNDIGDTKKSKDLIENGLELTKINRGTENHYYLEGIKTLVTFYNHNDSIEKAISTNQQVLNLAKTLFGDKHLEYRLALENLATLNENLNEFEKAIEVYNIELSLLPEGPTYTKDSIRIKNKIVNDLIVLNRYNEALNIQNKNIIACKKEFGESHIEYWNSLIRLASIHSGLRDYKSSIEMNNKALELAKIQFGEHSYQYRTSLNNLAVDFSLSSNFNKSLKINKKLVELRREVHGENDSRYITSLNNLSFNYSDLGDLGNAIIFSDSAYNLAKKYFGKGHPKTFSYAYKVACLQQKNGKVEKSEIILQNELESIEKKSGTENQYYFTGLRYLESFYNHIYETDKAIAINHKRTVLVRKLFGDKHQKYREVIKDLGSIYHSSDNCEKALEIHKKELALIPNELIHKKDSIIIYNKIILTLISLNLFNEAKQIHSKNIINCRKVFGENHVEYWNSLNKASLIHSGLEDHKTAIDFNVKALNLASNLFGERSYECLTSLSNLAINYSNTSNFNESLKINKKLVKLNREINGENHHSYIKSLNNLSFDYFDLGKFQTALNINDSAYNLSKKYFGEGHKSTIFYLLNLADKHKRVGNIKKSGSLIIKALELTKKNSGTENREYLDGLIFLAEFYRNTGALNKSININYKSLELSKKIYGDKHKKYLAVLNNLSLNFSQLGQHYKALENNLKIFNESAKTYGINNSLTVTSLYNIIVNLYALGDYERAKKNCEELLEITGDKSGKKNDIYLRGLQSMADIEFALGNQNKSLKLRRKIYNIGADILGKNNPVYCGHSFKYAVELIRHDKDFEAEKILFSLLDTNRANISSDFLKYKDFQSPLKSALWKQKKWNSLDSLIFSNNELLKKHLFKLIIGLDSNQKLRIKNTIYSDLEINMNYAINKKNEIINKECFNIWLDLNGLVDNEIKDLKRNVLENKDTSYLNLFQNWKIQKAKISVLLNSNNSDSSFYEKTITKEIEIANRMERELGIKLSQNSSKKSMVSYDDIKYFLEDNEALLDIIRLPYYNFNTQVWEDSSRYIAYIVSDDKTNYFKTIELGDGNILETEIVNEHLNFKTNSHKNGVPYKYFWKPLEKALEGKTKIYVAKGGVYNKINLSTLYNSETQKYLFEEKEIITVNNGRSFIETKTDTVEKYYSNSNAVLFGFPDYETTISDSITITNDDFFASTRDLTPQLIDSLSRSGSKASPLPETKKEVENISKELKSSGWNVEIFTKNKASEANIKKVNSPRVLHIATHGFFMNQAEVERSNGLSLMGVDKNNSMEEPLLRSGLLFAGANQTLQGKDTDGKENGILTAYEAAFLNLSETELVILSACETGKGEITNGEGVYGLRKSFADAGAKNVIMSLWNVDDKVTQEFMTLFYKNWNQGKTIREAFNSTRNSIKEKYPSPYYWGAFILVGQF